MENDKKIAEENQKRLKRVNIKEDFAQDFDIFSDEDLFEDFGEKIGESINQLSDVIQEVEKKEESKTDESKEEESKKEEPKKEESKEDNDNEFFFSDSTDMSKDDNDEESKKEVFSKENDSNDDISSDKDTEEDNSKDESKNEGEDLSNLQSPQDLSESNEDDVVEEETVEETVEEDDDDDYVPVLDPSEVRVHYVTDDKFFDNENSILTFSFIEENISDYFELGFEDSDINKELGKVNKINTLGQETYKHLYVVGLGKKEDLTESKLRSMASKVFADLDEEVNVDLITTDFYDKKILAKIFTEEFLLSRYTVNKITEDKKENDSLHIYLSSDRNLTKAIDKAAIKANSQNLAKDLIHIPSNVLNPEIFVDFIENLANELDNVIVDVKDTKKLVDEEFGLITSVNQGSSKNAYLVTLEYNGDDSTNNYKTLIGKGITFDTGGYSKKDVIPMLDMHKDMSGAAIAFATFVAIAKMNTEVNLRVVLPITENLINGNAYKPEDVIMSKSGKTVQIRSTDAEGRLILADSLTHAQSFDSDEFITIATLTASDSLTGNKITPFFSNSNELSNDFIKSAIDENENVWPMPLNHFDNVLYDSVLDSSDIADIANKNYDQKAFTIYGAEFIYYFLENKEENKFMHLDIGGQNKVDGKVVAPLTRTLINYFEK